jgi:PAS domain S-box-containing protein
LKSTPQDSASNSATVLARISVLSLLVVAVLVICGQLSVQQGLFTQSHDARVINMAGRENAISEKLSRCALAIDLLPTSDAVESNTRELEQELIEFSAQHESLLFGNVQLQIPDTTSSEIKELYAKAQPYYDALLKAGRAMVAEQRSGGYKPREIHSISAYTGEILRNQQKFFQLMSLIVDQYERESELRSEELETTQVSVVLTTILALLLVGIVILRPAINQIRSAIANLESTQGRLRDSEFRLATIINSMAEGVLVMSADGNLVLVNEEARKIHRMTEDQTDLNEFFWQYTFYENDKKTKIAISNLPICRALRGESTDDKELYLKRDSTREGLWVKATARPLRGGQNEIIGGLVVMQDITEFKKIDPRTDALYETFAHAVRDPLSSFSNIFSVLANEPHGLSAEAKVLIKVGKSECERLVRLMDDISDLRNLDKGRSELNHREGGLQPPIAGELAAEEGEQVHEEN